ncbi:molybdopterin cofactor-binding domain-containing protein [Novosphingobium sp. TH158]|uniref:xanthine dehydrogenase family protein molybdopterin-binding subunit n=1 Tax=Novosphingobium sp. TH158 TaxID=2067455 RepID=UPI000C7C7C28|nr:molybdopterin cofactor-binding domain-containing protein [Novosphingobium sp. TH158]PLK26511.1 xanthine dehydrogenase family protein molybdopterin-binding subunit [Novosphingobium sp. TH158]
MNAPVLNRRAFLSVSALAGGGMALGLTMPGAMAATAPAGSALSVWVAIAADGKVEITSKNPEIGQGIKTSLPMMVAEELDCDWAQVSVLQSDYNPKLYGRQFAGGSQSTPQNWLPMRQAGAAARQMLLAAAASRHAVPVAELSTDRGWVLHKASSRKWSYGELASLAATMPVPDPARVPLKNARDFRIIGKPTTGVDSARVLRGEPLFGIDTRLPGMLHAVLEVAPAHGGKLIKADLAAARAARGVVAVLQIAGTPGADGLPDGIAVIATNHWYAEQARKLLAADWDLSAAKGHSSEAYAAEAARLHDKDTPKDLRRDGDALAGIAAGARQISQRYSYQYLSHAPLEPQNCTALFQDGKLELWAPTQNPGAGADAIERHLGIPQASQTIHITRNGGGFGRRLMGDFMLQAAAIAKALPGKPIKLLWNRQDDLQRDYFRPGGWHSLRAGIDASGKLIGLFDHFVTVGVDGKPGRSAGMRDGQFPAGLIPDLLYVQSVIPSVIPTGPMRAPESNALAFVMNGFLDEVAEMAGKDLPQLVLELCAGDRTIGDPGDPSRASSAFITSRARGVVERVLKDCNWAGRPKSGNRRLGFGFYFCHLGYFAEVADVSVEAGAAKVHKVWVAADVGRQIVNPFGAESQVRGSVIDGIAEALHHAITFKDGVIDQKNFDSYALPRISSTPEIAISWVLSDYPPSGLGEPALPPVLPAVTNAISAATGKRIRDLPARL